MRFMPTKTKSSAKKPVSKSVEKAPRKEETFTFKATHFYAILVVLAFSVGTLIGYMIWGRASASQAVAAPPSGPAAPANTPAPRYVRYKIPTDGFPSVGPTDAPITIVEFADFECPFCRQWNQQTYQPLMAAYPGKIRFVYRDFPLLQIHPNSVPAAEAAQCANEQNAFWPFHDKLYSSDSFGADVYRQYAQDLGLDMTKFDECLSTRKYQQYVQSNSDFIRNLGGNSTPIFFINGLAIIGAQPISVFRQVIDKELAGEIPTQSP